MKKGRALGPDAAVRLQVARKQDTSIRRIKRRLPSFVSSFAEAWKRTLRCAQALEENTRPSVPSSPAVAILLFSALPSAGPRPALSLVVLWRWAIFLWTTAPTTKRRQCALQAWAPRLGRGHCRTRLTASLAPVCFCVFVSANGIIVCQHKTHTYQLIPLSPPILGWPRYSVYLQVQAYSH